MNDFTHEPPAGQGAGNAMAEQDQPTAGRLLAELRQAAGMHVATLASILKVSEARVEALEADQYDAFPDAMFMRALASSACRVLKADPAPVLALLPGGQPAPLRVGGGINASYKDSAPRSNFGPSSAAPRSRLVAWAIGALLLAALAVALWPASKDGNGALAWLWPSSASQAVVSEPVGAPPAGATASEGAQADAVPSPGSAAPAAAASDAPASVATAASPAASQSVAPDAAAAPAAAQVLVLRARAPSWVQVRSQDGKVVLEKTLAEGESAAIPGAPPWAVKIGRADVTEAIVRGTPLDLKPFVRDNVARFEVK